MIGLLNTGAGGDPNAPTAPWGRDDSLGNDPMSARGNMWGDDIGDSFGAGGLGLSGIGEGGGGRGEGIGLGYIGTIGHGAGTGTGQGFGSGHGRLGGSHPTTRPAGPHGRDARSTVGSRPRSSSASFARTTVASASATRTVCATTRTSQGRVSVRFVIGRDGAVSNVQQRRLGHAGSRRSSSA